MIVLARTGLSEKSRPLVSVRRIMICKTVGSRTMEPLIPSVLGLLALVLAACSKWDAIGSHRTAAFGRDHANGRTDLRRSSQVH